MNFPEVKLPPRARCRMFQKSPHSPSQSPTLPRGTTFLTPKTPFTVFEHSALHGSPARTHWLLPKKTEAMKRWTGLGVRDSGEHWLRWPWSGLLLREAGVLLLTGRSGRPCLSGRRQRPLHPSCRTTSRPTEGKPVKPWWPFKATMNPLLEGNCLRFILHKWRQRVWPFRTESLWLSGNWLEARSID